MTNVIDMYKIDEITGLTVPNKRHETEYVIVVAHYGEAIFSTYNEALAKLHEYEGGEIVVM
jgi:hypothetical protein